MFVLYVSSRGLLCELQSLQSQHSLPLTKRNALGGETHLADVGWTGHQISRS